MIDAQTQCALYGMEMLSHSIGRSHAITILSIDADLWIWYYDRQGIIQTSGINFLDDLPRLLVLLLAFQRFRLDDWGIISSLNPAAVTAANVDPDTEDEDSNLSSSWTPRDDVAKETSFTLDLKDFKAYKKDSQKPAKIAIELEEYLSHKPHCTSGRATSVVRASPISGINSKPETGLVCKIYHPEARRNNEATILEEIYKKVEKYDDTKTMKKYLPELVAYNDIEGYETNHIRSVLGIDWKGYRVLRILVLKKLEAITILKGKEFVKAWLETIKCHAFLWQHGIEHGDPSLWNILYNSSESYKCGVLSDFDLSIKQEPNRVMGTERTGTIPFMAVELLSEEYWDGLIKREYRHELEAFIWILAFVCLRYRDGKACKGSPVDAWMTANYKQCAKEKSHLWQDGKSLRSLRKSVHSDFQREWDIACDLLSYAHISHFSIRTELGKVVDDPSHKANIPNSPQVWESFIDVLEKAAGRLKLEYLADLIRDLDLKRFLPDEEIKSEP